jgi:hypothetical protein
MDGVAWQRVSQFILPNLAAMKLDVSYVNDREGRVKAVQVPIPEWRRLLRKVKHYEQVLQVKSDLADALGEVKELQRVRQPQTLQQFLNEL